MPFDPFGDFNTKGYLRNTLREKDPVIIKKLEHSFFEANLIETDKFLGEGWGSQLRSPDGYT